ncbi:MAG: hypothetical protein RMJ88_15275 [Thermogemmata sp.]|nr:hypothetical protein [Thermogemmata sp.]
MKALHRLRPRFAPIYLIALPLLLPQYGCGSESGAEVRGRVTFNGQPLRAGKVTFYHPTRPGRNVIADIRPDGTYHAYACPWGDVKVTVQPLRPRAAGTSRGRPYSGVKKAADAIPLIPQKYLDPATTDIVCPVRQNKQTFDIELKS